MWNQYYYYFDLPKNRIGLASITKYQAAFALLVKKAEDAQCS